MCGPVLSTGGLALEREIHVLNLNSRGRGLHLKATSMTAADRIWELGWVQLALNRAIQVDTAWNRRSASNLRDLTIGGKTSEMSCPRAGWRPVRPPGGKGALLA